MEHSEIPHEHKCGHVLALDNGNFAIQPNNRILWNISNFTVNSDVPDYKVQTTEWNLENLLPNCEVVSKLRQAELISLNKC